MKFQKYSFLFVTALFTLISCQETNKKVVETNEEKVTAVSKNVSTETVTTTLKIDGMKCSVGCAKAIEKNLAKSNGVQSVTVDFDSKEATVTFDANVTNPDNLKKVVESSADGKTYVVENIKTKV